MTTGSNFTPSAKGNGPTGPLFVLVEKRYGLNFIMRDIEYGRLIFTRKKTIIHTQISLKI